MIEMTSEERLRAALKGDDVDRVPFSPFLAYVWEHFPAEIRDRGQRSFLTSVGADPLWRGAPCPVAAHPPELVVRTHESGRDTTTETVTPVGTLRSVTRRSDQGNTSFLIEHPLKTPDDFRTLMWIEEHTTFSCAPERVEKHFAGDGRVGLSLGMLVPRGKSAYQSLVEHHVGTEELIYATVDFPDVVDDLLAVMVANDEKAVRLAARAPYEYYISWEDSSTTNYSPAQYDRYIGPEIGHWCEILAEHGKRYIQHACGHVKDLVVRMRDHGAYGIESISPPPTGNVEVRDARAATGSEFAIIGGIEPTAFLNLSLAKLGPYAERVIEDGSGGPFVLANSDSCPPGVTVEKFRLVADVTRSVGVC